MELDVSDHPAADPPADPAATIVLLRDGPGEIEVLMMHGGADADSAGMWVFPGGPIETSDVAADDGRDPIPAARRAAAREARDRTGIMIDIDRLVSWSHWLPPLDPLGTKRFSTWFFVAPVETADASAPVRPESADGVEVGWIGPGVALGMQERGEILVAPPTYVTLQQLCRYGDVATVLAAADPFRFATEIVVAGGLRRCLWAGDADYRGGDPAADGARHRLVMDDVNGWRYVNTVGTPG